MTLRPSPRSRSCRSAHHSLGHPLVVDRRHDKSDRPSEASFKALSGAWPVLLGSLVLVPAGRPGQAHDAGPPIEPLLLSLCLSMSHFSIWSGVLWENLQGGQGGQGGVQACGHCRPVLRGFLDSCSETSERLGLGSGATQHISSRLKQLSGATWANVGFTGNRSAPQLPETPAGSRKWRSRGQRPAWTTWQVQPGPFPPKMEMA